MESFKVKSEYAGLRAIALARCSTPQQVEFSIDRQIDQIRLSGEQRGIRIIGEERLEGVSGLNPEARDDIDRLIARKVQANDFDAVVLADVDRLTRAGVDHSFHIKYELNRHGIEIIFARDDVPRGEFGWLVFALKSAEANADIRKITTRLHEGITKAILEGRNVHSPQAPYACDKLISTPDGQPIHRVRKLADGSYVLLDPVEERVLRSIPKRGQNEQPNRFKSPRDNVTLVPGDPARVAIVRTIYQLYYEKHLSSYMICKHLNDQGFTSGNGKLWARAQVQNLLENSVYFGIGMTNLSTGAGLTMRGNTTTSMKPPTQVKIGRRKQKLVKPKRHRRDPDHWLVVKYPSLLSILDGLSPEVRAAAKAGQIERLERIAAAERTGAIAMTNITGRKSGGDPHKGSEYFLSGILRCAESKRHYTGRPGRGNRRYYRNSARAECPSASRPILDTPLKVSRQRF
jgi:DNA invertase Pin-like site-specific DNA recombinase